MFFISFIYLLREDWNWLLHLFLIIFMNLIYLLHQKLMFLCICEGKLLLCLSVGNLCIYCLLIILSSYELDAILWFDDDWGQLLWLFIGSLFFCGDRRYLVLCWLFIWVILFFRWLTSWVGDRFLWLLKRELVESMRRNLFILHHRCWSNRLQIAFRRRIS